MELRLPFDAARVMEQTSLRRDYPDVWSRYLEKLTVSYGLQTGVRIKTRLGYDDLVIIRNHFELWLAEQDLIDPDDRDRDAATLIFQATHAVYAINLALKENGMLASEDATANHRHG